MRLGGRSTVAGLVAAIRDLSYGFLLVPGVVAVAFLGLAAGMLALDAALGSGVAFPGGPDAARQVLSVIAGSLITVAGVAFSITIVTLQLVSSQFTPRALREFLRDRLNQLVAGIFLGTFSYCLVVLSRVGSSGNTQDAFVPGLSVGLAVLLGIANIAALLIFIHHLSQAIQVSNIAAGIARQGLRAVDRLYPERYGDPMEGDPDVPLLAADVRGRIVRANRPGYVQAIALDEIASEWGRIDAEQRDADASQASPPVIRVCVAPGDFVSDDTALVECWPPHETEGLDAVVQRSVRVADARDTRQDAAYAIRQLVDIALRAISPSVNDPTTAVTCIGYIRAITARMAGRRFPAERRRIGDPSVLVLTRRRQFADIAAEAFAEIGRYGRSDPRVIGELLGAIADTVAAAAATGASDRVEALADIAVDLARPAMEDARTESDRLHIEQRLEATRQAQVDARRPADERPAEELGTSS